MITLITTQLIASRESLESLESFISKNILESNVVSSIHILAEDISAEAAKYLIEKYEGLIIKPIQFRPTFGQLIEYALENKIRSELIAFTNADIYFSAEQNDIKTLLNLTKKCSQLGFTLTRRDDNNIDQLLSVDYPVPELLSSDAWIFSVKEFKDKKIKTTGFESIFLGQMNLENIINTCFHVAGFQLCNAANIIKAIHLDVSDNDYRRFDGKSVIDMAKNSQAATVNAYISNSILPIPRDVCQENFIPSKYTAVPIKTSSQYIYCDLPTKNSNVLVSSLASLTSISNKYNLIVYLVSHENSTHELSSMVAQLTTLFPNIIRINADNTRTVIQRKRNDSFIVVSHPGVINEKIISARKPIFVLNSTLSEQVYNWQSFGAEGYIDLAWNGKSIDAWKTTDKSKIFYNKTLQLITCIFKSKKYITSFLENSSNLAKMCAITHSLIGSKPDQYTLGSVLDYLSSGNDGFYVNLPSDPGLYECWNILINFSYEDYISNANPDDLRIETHAANLIAMLEMEENRDIQVASSNVFPIYPSDRFNTPVTQIAQDAGTGWFSDTPKNYGLESLFEPTVDDNGLIKPKNIPHCAPVWRRSIHENYGYFDERQYGSEADYGLWVKYASDGGKFAHWNENLSGYYIDEQSYGRLEAIPEGRKRVIASCAPYLSSEENGFLQKLSGQIIDNKNRLRKFKINVHSMKGHYGDHRFSNNAILESFSNIHSEDAEISFIWFLEKYFIWGHDDGEARSESFVPITKPWIGVLHVPPLTPKWAGNQFADLYNQEEWNSSLKFCKGLISLSEYMMNDLKLIYPNIKHYSLTHPIQKSPNQFIYQQFKNNPQIVLSGYWLRQHKLFYEWQSPLKKIHLLKRCSLDFMHQEYAAHGEVFNYSDKTNVEQVKFLPNHEYDKLLTSSIVFLYLYETSANNAVLECIMMATPFISERHPAIEEYVGKDYPFFVNISDLADLSLDEVLSLSLQSHEYLKSIASTKDFSLEKFVKSTVKIAKSH